MKETTVFPNFRRHTDQFHDDGYVISDANKQLIDACLQDFPETLFLRDLPEKDEDIDGIDQDPITYSPLSYAFRSTDRLGYGWGATYVFQSVTSVMAYLIAQGAGIGFDVIPHVIDLRRLPVQLFVGTSDAFRTYTPGSELHVYQCADIVKLHRAQRLTTEDMLRLKKQAMNALRYGNFNDIITLELIKISLILESFISLKQGSENDELSPDELKVKRMTTMVKSGMINQLTDRQLFAYVEYNQELLIGFLQAFHQQIPEIVFNILSEVTGLSMIELADIGNKVIEKHKCESPAYQLRR